MKKIFTVVLVLGVFFIIGLASVTAADVGNSQELQIQELYGERAKILAEEEVDKKKLKKVEKDLEKLGVKFLTTEEVKKQFPNKKNEKYIEQNFDKSELSLITPQVAVPNAPNITWSTYRSTVYADGKTYDVQRLVAQAKNANANIQYSGFRTVRSTYNWKAGNMNLLTTGAKTAGGQIPGVGYAISVYDAVKGFVTGISRETTVTDANINYDWNLQSTAVFSYVKLDHQSDDYQDLSYISTRLDGYNGYTVHTFENNDDGTLDLGTNRGSKSVTVIPPGYDSGFNAVDAYNSPYAKSRATVTRYDIGGIEGSNVTYIYPIDPAFPAHVY